MTGHTDGIVVGGCRLGEIIGRGGMGTVYAAVQSGVNRPVAVKLMPITGGDDAAIARFQREAQTAGALDHPHCLPLYAAGESDGLLYLVMRLVNGPNLAQLIDEQGWLPPARAAKIITQIAGAVDSAHRAGLVHRDLKPANILIEPRENGDHAFVSDFGLMRGVIDDREITLAGQWLGTSDFAAPEQMRGESVGPPADIYALGAILDYILGPQRPRAADAVIARAMAPDPGGRYRSAGEFGEAARNALLRSSVRAQRRRRNRGPALMAGALVAGLIAVVVVAVVVITNISGNDGPTATTNGSTSGHPNADNRLVTSAFAATVPKGWTPAAQIAQQNGFTRWTLQNPSGTVTVDIDRTANATASLEAHLKTVKQGIESNSPKTYRFEGQYDTSFPGGHAIVWEFSVSGQPGSERVDIFRQIGSSQYAVLGSSSSLKTSRAAASEIAYSLKVP
jgi:Protein kinase domain